MGKFKCIAFDCFGTVFDASTLTREDLKAYVDHVKAKDFSPFEFGDPWWKLEAHEDSRLGIAMIQAAGVKCMALSNGSVELIQALSDRARIHFDWIADMVKHRVYKPDDIDAYRLVQKYSGFAPDECMMVTANPTFGDLEGAVAVGMKPQVIRNPGTPPTIIDLAKMLDS